MLKLIKLEDRIVLDGAAMIEAAEQAVDAALESSAAGLDALGDAGAEALTDLALAPLQDKVDAVVDTILSPDAPEAESLVLLSRAVENFDMLRDYAAVNHSVLPFDDFSSGVESRAGEVVIIDPRVDGVEELVSSVSPAAQVFVLDRDRDPIDQISELLAGRSGVNAVHIVAHGGSGSLALGDTLVDSGTLAARSSEIASWGGSMSDTADILVYGCNVAEGDKGRAFVDQFSELTGADVAASEDLTGDAAQGGDWDLEYSAGLVEARAAFSKAVMERYAHVLEIAVPTDLTGTVAMWFDADDNATVETGAEEDPSSLAGTYAGHYDVIADGTDATDGQEVNYWKDKSGNAHNAFLDDDTAQSYQGIGTVADWLPTYDVGAINGRNALYFDGTDSLAILDHQTIAQESRTSIDATTNDFMNFNDFSVFTVMVAEGADGTPQAANGIFLSASEDGGAFGRAYFRYYDSSPSPAKLTSLAMEVSGSNSTASAGRASIFDPGLFSAPLPTTLYTATYNQSNDDTGNPGYYESKIYQSGEFGAGITADKPNTTIDQITIGGNRNDDVHNAGASFQGWMAEMIILDHDATENTVGFASETVSGGAGSDILVDANVALTEGERFQIESYLSAKWDTGLAVATIVLDGADNDDNLTWDVSTLNAINARAESGNLLDVVKTIGTGGDTTLTLTSSASTTGAVTTGASANQLTVDDVQTFLRTLKMESGTTTGTRTITYTWAGFAGTGNEDGGGQDVITVDVLAAEQPSIINWADGSGTYTENQVTALDLEPGESAGITDGGGFEGGQLVIDLKGQADMSGFTVGLDGDTGGDTVSIDSNTVYLNATSLGTFSGASGGDATITWGANADASSIGEVLQALSIDSDLELMGDDISAEVYAVDADNAALKSNTVTIDVTLVDDNDAPEWTQGATDVEINENTDLTLNTDLSAVLQFDDVDDDGADMTLTLAVDEGILTVTPPAGVTISSGDGTGTVILTGAKAALNDLLDGAGDGSVIYKADDAPALPVVTLTATINDDSNTSESPTVDPKTAAHALSITVTPENDAPEATVASGIVMNENTPLPLHGGGYLTISDPDAGSGDVSVVVSVAEGTISAVLGDSTMDAPVNSESAVTLVGTVQEIQDFLDGNTSGSLTYFAPDNPPTATSVTLFINDLGNSPSGSLTAQDTGTISINAQDDPPILLLDPLDSDGTVGTVDFTTSAYGDFESVALLSSSGTADNILRPDGDGEIQDVTIEYGIDAIGGIRDSSGNKEQFIIDNGAGSTMTIDLAAGTTTGASTLAFGGTNFTVSAPSTGTLVFTEDGGGTATSAQFEQLLQAIRYNHTEADVTDANREFTFTVEDADGLFSSEATATVVVADQPAPSIGGLDGNQVTFTENDSGAAVLADGAIVVVSDEDDSHLGGGGTLVVNIDDPTDTTLGFDGVTSVSVVSGEVLVGLVTVGLIDGGFDGDGKDLHIAWTTDATKDLVEDVISALSLTNDAEIMGADRTIEISTTDGSSLDSNTATVTVEMVEVNSAPVWTGGSVRSINENDGFNFSDFAANLGFTDADADDDTVTGTDIFTLTVGVASGTLVLDTGTTGLGAATTETDTSIVIAGTRAQLQDLFDDDADGSIIYNPDDDLSGTDPVEVTVNFAVSDGANTSEDGLTDATGTHDVVLTITPENDAPTASIGAPLTMLEADSTLNLQGIAWSVSDPDVANGTVTATLAVNDGTLTVDRGSNSDVTLNGDGGLTSDSGQTIEMTGLLSDINDILAGNGSPGATVTYTADNSPDADTSLTLSIDDGGNTGAGGNLTDTTVVDLDITPEQDAPTLLLDPDDTDAGAAETVDSSVTVVAGGAAVNLAPSGSGTDDNIVLLDNEGLAPGANDTIETLVVDYVGTPDVGEEIILGSVTVDLNAQTLSTGGTSVTVSIGGNDYDVTLDAANYKLTITPDAVSGLAESEFEEVVEALQYQYTEVTPTTSGPRNIELTLTDSDGETGTATATMDVTNLPRPTIANLSGTVTYEEGATAVLIDVGSDAEITDHGEPDLDGGTLTVSADDYLGGEVTLGLRDGYQGVSVVSTSLVMVDGLVVGTIVSNADGQGEDLKITWNEHSTLDKADKVIQALTVEHSGDLLGATNPTLTIESSDATDTAVSPSTVTVSLVDVNNAPVVDGGTSVNVDEQTGFTLSDLGSTLSITDVDAASGELEMILSLSADQGDISVDTAALAISGITGNDSDVVTVTGTLADLNDLLDGTAGSVVFTGNQDAPASEVTLTVSVDDKGNTDEDTNNSLSDSHELIITIDALNDGPSAVITGPLNATEDVAFDLVGALDVSDPDAGSGDVSVTLSVNDGTLNVNRGSNTNVEVLNSANGQDVTAVTLVGTVQEINDLLDGANLGTVTYTSDDSPSGSTSITLSIDDAGNTGGPGSQTFDTSAAIVVAAADDDPVVRLDAQDSAPNDSTLTDIGITAAGGGDPVAFVTSADGSDNLVLPDNGTPGGGPDEIASLVIGFGGNTFDAEEQLLILGDSSTTTTLDLSDETLDGLGGTSATVTVGGVAFDLTVDQGANTMTFTPDGAPTSATETEFEALLEALRYEHTSLAPSTGSTRDFSFTVTDTDASTGVADATITVTDAPRPTIANLGGSIDYNEGDGQVLLDAGSDAEIGDIDDLVHLNGGTLTVSADDYLSGQVTLGFDSGSNVSVVDTSNVVVSGTTIGTIVPGNDGVATDLLVAWTTDDATYANIDQVIRALTVQHDGDLLGSTNPTITIESSDSDDTAVAPNTVVVNLVDVNNAPTFDSGATSALVDEQTDLVISQLGAPLVISDVDADGGDLVMVLTVPDNQGTISLDTALSVTDNETTAVSVTGTIAELNDLLDDTTGSVIFTGTTDTPNASVVLNVNVNDQGNTDENPANTATASHDLTITVNAINDAPDATIDAQPTFAENATRDLASSLRVSDVDAGTGDVTVTLSVNDGTLNVAEGGNAVSVSGSGSGSVVMTGALSEINNLLDGVGSTVEYVSDHSPDPDTSLTLVIDDGGNTGGPGAQTSTLAIADLDVTPSDDAPQVILDPRDGLTGQDADVGESVNYSADLVAGTGPVSLMTTGSGNTSDNLVLLDNDGPGGATDDLLTTLVIDYSGTPVAGDPDPGEVIIIGDATVDLDAGSVDNATVTIGGNPYTIAVNGGSQQIEVTASGAGVSSADFEGLLEALRYDHTDATPTNEGDRTLVLTVTDDDGQTGTANAVISVAENQAPVATVPDMAASEGVPLDLRGKITVNDADTVSEVDIQSVTLSVTNGVLNVSPGNTGVGVSGTGSGTVVLTGTEAQIDNLLAGGANAQVAYLQAADVPPASAVLTVTATDGYLTASDTGTIAISPVNDLPVVTVPDVGPVNEGGAALGLLGKGITVDDVDNAPEDIMALTLSVPTGKLNVNGLPPGISVVSGAGTDRLVLRGTEAKLDAFLAGNAGGGLDYVSPPNAPKGPFQLSAELNDGSGSGTDQGVLEINHLPEFTNPTDVAVTSGTQVTSLGGQDLDPDTFSYAIQPGLDGGLFEVVNGTELRFKAAPADGDYQVSVRISDGRGGFRTQTFNVNVALPVVDAPPADTGSAPRDEGSGADSGLPDLSSDPQDTEVESLFDGGLGQTESKVQVVGGGDALGGRPGVGGGSDGPDIGGNGDSGNDGLGAGGAQGDDGADLGDGFDPGSLVTDAGGGSSAPEGGSPEGDVDGPDRFARAPEADQRIGAGNFNDFGSQSPLIGGEGTGAEGGDGADAIGDEADPGETELAGDQIFGSNDFGFGPQLAGVFGTPGDGVDPGGGERPDAAGDIDPFGGSGLFAGQGDGPSPFRDGSAGSGPQADAGQPGDEGADGLDIDTASGDPIPDGPTGDNPVDGLGDVPGAGGLPGLGGQPGSPDAAGGLGGNAPDIGLPGQGLFADGPGDGPEGTRPEVDPRELEEEEAGPEEGAAGDGGVQDGQGAVGPAADGGGDAPSTPQLGPQEGTLQDVIDRAGEGDGEEEEEAPTGPDAQGEGGQGGDARSADSEGADGAEPGDSSPEGGESPEGEAPAGEAPEVELLGENEAGEDKRGKTPPKNA